MPRRNVTARVLAVRLLIIKKNVGAIRREKRCLRQAAEKYGLINADIPSTQGSNDTLVRGRRARSHKRRPQWRILCRQRL